MNANELFPSKYLSAADLKSGELTLTISGISREEMSRDGKKEYKPVVSFIGADKGIVLNVTNTNTLIELYGDDTDLWVGRQITLYAARVPYGGKMVDGIRIRNVIPQVAAAVTPTRAPASSSDVPDTSLPTPVMWDNWKRTATGAAQLGINIPNLREGITAGELRKAGEALRDEILKATF